MAEPPSTFVKSITTELRKLRKANKITGEQLAERLEIPVQNLRRIEAGQNITLKTLAKIAEALGFEVKITFTRSR